MPLKTLGQLNPIDSLTVFDRFQIDENLPKFKGITATNNKGKRPYFKIQPGADFTLESSDDDEDSSELHIGNGGSTRAKRQKQIFPIFSKIKKLFAQKDHPPTPIPWVFNQILTNPEELKIFNEREKSFQDLLFGAIKMGQKSLIKELTTEEQVRKFENTLFALNQKKYISEKQLLEFVRKCEKGLCLDWLSHFIRPVPPEIIERKIKCDSLNLFDNYVVLHYDPFEKGTTKAEREKEEKRVRDPILFGVIRGSRKLYFVGDWTDELCNLTLQQIIDKLGDNLEMK